MASRFLNHATTSNETALGDLGEASRLLECSKCNVSAESILTHNQSCLDKLFDQEIHCVLAHKQAVRDGNGALLLAARKTLLEAKFAMHKTMYTKLTLAQLCMYDCLVAEAKELYLQASSLQGVAVDDVGEQMQKQLKAANQGTEGSVGWNMALRSVQDGQLSTLSQAMGGGPPRERHESNTTPADEAVLVARVRSQLRQSRAVEENGEKEVPGLSLQAMRTFGKEKLKGQVQKFTTIGVKAALAKVKDYATFFEGNEATIAEDTATALGKQLLEMPEYFQCDDCKRWREVFMSTENAPDKSKDFKCANLQPAIQCSETCHYCETDPCACKETEEEEEEEEGKQKEAVTPPRRSTRKRARTRQGS